jgi:glycosyltransferase involved in cell wall biosynthesis
MKISVIVPIFNTEKYLERCIESILSQTYSDFEVILVDDGSTDSSLEIAERYAKADTRVKVLHKENGGSSSARNLGIKNAAGDYFSFIDSDDYIEPFMLERLSEPVLRALGINAEPPRIVQIGRDEMSEDGSRRPDICTPPEQEQFEASKDFFRSLIMHVGDCSFCTKIVSKELFENREFPVGKLNEDFKLLVNMLQDAEGVVNLPGYAYHVFYSSGSNTRKVNKDDFSRVYQDCVDNADEVTEIVNRFFPELKKEALRFNIFQRLEYMLHIPISKMKSDYPGYKEVVAYLRKNYFKGITNPYLTGKNKLYLTLFAMAPRFVRRVHAKVKGL